MTNARIPSLPNGSAVGSILKLVIGIVLAIVVLGALLGSSYTVPTGARGVLLKFSKAVDSPVLPGLHFKMPYRDHVVIIPITIQRATANADVQSNDLQQVSSTVVLNYHINPQDVVSIYSNIGSTPQMVEQTIIDPAIQEVLKSVAARYTAAQLITDRPKVAQAMGEELKRRIESRGLSIDAFSITNFSFSPTFAKAIEDKTAAEQNVLTAQQTLQKAKIDAEQKVALASAEAQATLLRAKAEAQALQLQREQVSPELVQLRTVEVLGKLADKWNGQAPETLSVGGAPASLLVPTKGTSAGLGNR